MKEVKKFLLGFLTLISLTLVSAYAGNYYGFNLRDFFGSTLEYLPFVIVFLGIFYASNLIFRRLIPRTSWAIALIFSLLLTYGLTLMNIDFNSVFFKLGMTEDALFKIAPWIVLGFAVITLWFGNFGKLIILFGLIIAALGITRVAQESGAAIMLGIILTLIGLWINKREKRKKLYKSMSLRDRAQYKLTTRSLRNAQAQEWNRAGKKIGRGIAKTTYYGSRPFALVYKGAKQFAKRIRGREQIPPSYRSNIRKDPMKLSPRQARRERGRKSALRRINQEKRVIQKQMNNKKISAHSKRVLRDRERDLERRLSVLKRYGPNKGNL